MKLNELAVANPTKQAAKVFESYFGNRVSFDTIDQNRALKMLRQVRGLVAEHRRTPEFHRSEQNPAYLKLVVMEQALSARIMELEAQPGTTPVAGQPNPQAMAMQTAQKRKEIDDQIKQLQDQIRALQQQRNMPAMGMSESRRKISESEVQQAQVVLAAQDMVDEVQKMSEQVSAMQFKDLPALVDSIKNQVGQDQATQFNGDASAALSALLQNLQGSKQQLDQALGVVTGQAPAVPGADAGMDAGMDASMAGEIAPDMSAELPAGEEEIETDIEVDDEKDSDALATSLGRGRR
jgi:chromosome segregation ATPase